MKRFLSFILALSLVIALASCKQNEAQEITPTEQDKSPVTMFIPMGNGENYYTELAGMIKEDLGIETEFVYQICGDTSNMINMFFENKDLPADIIFTSAKTDNGLLEDCCVDLLSNSSITALFSSSAIQNAMTEDGKVYQLPISSKLIGITYNETLLEELGAQVPQNYEDMLSLKKLCDEKGVKFAVSDGAASGHGFNYLFHLMGAQWLSTPEGTDWFEGYQKGERTADEFKEKCEYFKKWTEEGLWGSFHTEDWKGSEEFSKTRALFWFSILNSSAGYEGPEFDENGNETGKMLNDTYKTIPWISEDGSNNCFTFYDNCWVTVNNALLSENKSEKLEKVFRILEYMTSDKATALVSGIGKDTYVSVNNYDMGDDRLYSNYDTSITNGFTQPWYYNSFDTDSIVFTGEKLNAYIAGTGTFDEIFDTLDTYNQKNLGKETEILASFPEGLDYENTAKLLAVSQALSLNKTLEENGIDGEATVTLAPYTPAANLLPPWRGASVSNFFVHKGDYDAGKIMAFMPNSVSSAIGIYMTGSEIKELVENKFDPSDRFIDEETGEKKFDSENYGPYPYVCLVKGEKELVDDEEYLVALNEKYLTKAQYDAFYENGKVLEGLENPVSISEGIKEYALENPVITQVRW